MLLFNQEKLLKQVDDENERIMAANILDKAEQTLRSHEPVFSNFLNPYQRSLVEPVLDKIHDLKYRSYGAFKKAERKILALAPDYYMWELLTEPLVILEIKGNFKFENVNHRDFLGAILGTGIKRELIGDLLVADDGCQVIVLAEIKEYLLLNLERVHKVPVEIEEISAERLSLPTQRVKKIKSTVASLRLDSVASSGFATSRTKMAREIEAGKVKLNWQQETDPAQKIDLTDVISIRGRGRVEIDEILGESKKGRIKLVTKRYL
ncbi:photosystem II S4 domain protein [Fuchsiella alkaliacetigena]|uniref:photosystem II S4 domain protein n=1 Tax=Fuchsiella alkaliacetigena TaxID=957042 RepID=UPI00200A026D|nr:photosystem II S4 domain protein [Fuchsiella alkaliacetigena]MCK8823703.1 photosystem II S4 domain protein [Fuchsiella alkaliacetigena]